MTPPSSCCKEPDALPGSLRLFLVCMSFSWFACVFLSSWSLYTRFTPKWFHTQTISLKADHCARIGSSVHAVVIAPGLLIAMLHARWSQNAYAAESSVAGMQALFCYSVGYFLYDLLVLIHYRLPQWPAFTAHHVMAMIPFVNYLFVKECDVGIFVLGGFLLVEFAVIPLNAQAFLEQAGFGSSRLYSLALYTTFVTWIGSRIVNPLFLIWVVHKKVWPSAMHKMCLVPGIVSAYFIAVFCIYVFVVILWKEVRLRWAASPGIRDVAQLTPHVRPLSNPHIHLEDDEREILTRYPERMMLHEVRERVHDIEHAIDDAIEHARERRGLVGRRPAGGCAEMA